MATFLLSGCGLFQSAQLPPREGIMPGETINVEGGENVYAVARKYNVSMRELIVLNGMHAPFTLYKGEKLTLPANKIGSEAGGGYGYGAASGGPTAPTPNAAPSGAIEESTLPPIQVPAMQPKPGPSSGLTPAPVTSSQVEALNAPSAPPKTVTTTIAGSKSAPAASSDTPSPPVTFKWPVQGPILSGYGPKGQGLSNDGVNIGAPKGAPVVAAANGIVVYAGNEMKGFGNLVLIRHQGGWVTAYAHLDRALVSKDAVVAQGDMIGTVGKTGNVSSPQLHFETRYQGKPVDPSGAIKSE